jgi:hypothetical protein
MIFINFVINNDKMFYHYYITQWQKPFNLKKIWYLVKILSLSDREPVTKLRCCNWIKTLLEIRKWYYIQKEDMFFGLCNDNVENGSDNIFNNFNLRIWRIWSITQWQKPFNLKKILIFGKNTLGYDNFLYTAQGV